MMGTSSLFRVLTYHVSFLVERPPTLSKLYQPSAMNNDHVVEAKTTSS